MSKNKKEKYKIDISRVKNTNRLSLSDEEKELAMDSKTKNQHEAHGRNIAYTLGGLSIREDGTLNKSNIANILTKNLPDDYSDIVLSSEEAMRLQGAMLGMATGATASMPVICTGPECPWKDRCPYWQMNKAPIGRQCLVELNLLKQWQLNYMEEYEISPDNFTEWNFCNELAEIELRLWRINMWEALHQDQSLGVIQEDVAITPTGQKISQYQLSKFAEYREKLMQKKHKIIKLMVGDRQEKYKREAALKIREDQDPSSSMSELREKMDTLRRGLNKMVAQGAIPSEVQEVVQEEAEGGSGEPSATAEAQSTAPKAQEEDTITPDDILDSVDDDDD